MPGPKGAGHAVLRKWVWLKWSANAASASLKYSRLTVTASINESAANTARFNMWRQSK